MMVEINRVGQRYGAATPPVPAKRLHEARRAATRAGILDAAWHLARRKGIAALSLRDLAGDVGMRAPSLYTYFPSKNDLYDAMYEQALRDLSQTLDVTPSAATDLEALQQHVKRFATFCTSDPVRYQLIFERPVPGFVPSPASFAIGVKGLARTAELAHAAGIHGDRAFDLFRAVTTGLVTLQVANEPETDRWTRLVNEAVEMVATHSAQNKERK